MAQWDGTPVNIKEEKLLASLDVLERQLIELDDLIDDPRAGNVQPITEVEWNLIR